jgi:hypothetical protein
MALVDALESSGGRVARASKSFTFRVSREALAASTSLSDGQPCAVISFLTRKKKYSQLRKNASINSICGATSALLCRSDVSEQGNQCGSEKLAED